MRSKLLMLLASVSLMGLGKPTLLVNIPLQWRATSQLRLGTQQMSQAPIQFETFRDARADPHAIGENLEADTPKPVTTTDDVGAFVSTHMRELFDRAGLHTVDSNGAVLVRGEVRRFFVRETATYRSEVTIYLEVLDRGGNRRWSGVASGEATRFGRSYKAENYYEVLSDAIVNAVSSMLQSAEFQQVLSES